jgi:hypothetical protein
MAAGTTEDLTGLLAACSEGDQEALRHLVSVDYLEIRRIGRRYLGRSFRADVSSAIRQYVI